MKVRKGWVSAAIAALALGSTAYAEDLLSMAPAGSNQQVATDPVSDAVADASAAQAQINQPILGDDTTPTTRKPLMYGLDKVGLAKPLDDLGINIYGYVEVGYLYDFTVPHNISPPHLPASVGGGGDKILFAGPYKNSFDLDQVDLTVERTVDASKGHFDVGFRVEGIYGRDAYVTHSNGILDQDLKGGGVGGPDNQLDLEQAYVTFAIPLGTGLTVEAGKFATLMGYETINPTGNQFFTHSYSFTFGIPLTQTGILASYNFSPSFSFTGGITRGWNQSTDDNNGAIDGLFQAIYKMNKLTVTGNLSVGPESFLNFGPSDNHDYWVVPEAIASYKMSDQLTLTADLLYGLASSQSQWYGVAGYAGYTLNKMFTINVRGEFYHDGRSFTAGAVPGTDVNYAEGTLGVAITPLPDNQIFQYLTIRPEVRYDWADHAAYDFTQYNELTAAVDLVMQF